MRRDYARCIRSILTPPPRSKQIHVGLEKHANRQKVLKIWIRRFQTEVVLRLSFCLWLDNEQESPAVDIVTRLRGRRSWFDSRQGQRLFSVLKHLGRLWCPPTFIPNEHRDSIQGCKAGRSVRLTIHFDSGPKSLNTP